VQEQGQPRRKSQFGAGEAIKSARRGATANVPAATTGLGGYQAACNNSRDINGLDEVFGSSGRMTRKPKIRKAVTARRAKAPIRPLRVKKPDPVATLVVASAQILAVPLDPAWRDGVTRNLQLLFTHAAMVDTFSLPDESEPAPVFRA
jgi:hypothetical protein